MLEIQKLQVLNNSMETGKLVENTDNLLNVCAWVYGLTVTFENFIIYIFYYYNICDRSPENRL